MEDWEENTSSNSGVLRSTRFDDQNSRSGGELVKKREGAAASSSGQGRTARAVRDMGWVRPPRPRVHY